MNKRRLLKKILAGSKGKGKAKPYPVKQFLEIVELYNLPIGDDK